MELLSYILSSIIVVATPLIFVKILLNPKLRNDKSKVIVAILVALISSVLIYKYLDGIFRSLIGLVVYVVAIANCYNISIKKSIFLTVIYIILLMIPELLLLLILNIFSLSKQYFYTTFAGSLLSNLIIYSSVIFLTLVLKRKLNKATDIEENNNTKIIIFSILSLASILVFFFDVIENFRVGTKIIFYLIAIFTFVSALIIVVYEENKNIKLQSKYDKLLDFMEIYEVEIENERIMKHEYKNQLITIKSKIIDNDNKNNIIDYINNIIQDETNFVQEEYIKFQYLPPNGLKALLYFKVSSAKNKNINVNINIASTIKESILKDLTTKDFRELGMILGIYIDNAIDASEKSEEKLLGIEIYDQEDGIEFIISNSYTGKIDESKVGKVHFSTKGKGHGYGLLLVKKILKSNKRFSAEKEISEKLYIQSLLVKKQIR